MPAGRDNLNQDFGREFEVAQDDLMRRRLKVYLIVSTALNGLAFAINVLFAILISLMGRLPSPSAPTPEEFTALLVTLWGSALLALPAIVAYVIAMWRVYKRPINRADGLRLVYWIIVAPTLLALFGTLVISLVMDSVTPNVEDLNLASAIGWGGASSVFFAHFFASIFLPWRPSESVRPMIPIIGATAVLSLYAMWGDWAQYLLVIAVSIAVMVPGTLLCWFKTTRFSTRFFDRKLRDTYGEMKHELSAARQIHDAMFPDPITDGSVRVDYRYEPMRQIGGDYVFVRRDEDAVDLVLLDVTGHGVGAALTVNRLHGEVTRLLAEQTHCGPGELIEGLNRYLHITLARHSVYASAMCLRIEPGRDTLRYANAGHPPAFVFREGESTLSLDSTTFLLGVTAGDDFVPGEVQMPFTPGDRLIAYTDGATEALDVQGRQLRIAGIEGVLEKLAGRGGTWLDEVVAAVERHRHGAAQDDTLIVEVRRASTQG